MKLLICSPVVLRREFGASKVLIEVAEELRRIGDRVDLVDDAEMRRRTPGTEGWEKMPDEERLKLFLQSAAADYDVVEYDHNYLPFPRGDFPMKPLFVARSVLFALHFKKIKFPPIRRKRDWILDWFRRDDDVEGRENRYQRAWKTLNQADLINLSTSKDLPELERLGFDLTKTVVLPYGLSEDQVGLFEAVSLQVPAQPRIAFVGSYDARKGGADIPKIFARVSAAVPEAQLRLLGTAGPFQSTAEVKNLFPSHLRSRVEVFPTYKGPELPKLLEGCSVGIFPSYLEGFGFAVLEMLAAGLPVAAYDVPGPCDILSSDYLVPPGRWEEMADRLILLLKDGVQLAREREKARERSRLFRWKQIAQDTHLAYHKALEKKRAMS